MSLRTTRILLTVTLAVVLAAIPIAVYLISNTTGYDEDAHRAAVTEKHPEVDWSDAAWAAHRDIVADVCSSSEAGFRVFAEIQAGAGRLQLLADSLSYRCPERVGELRNLGLVNQG